MRTQPIARALFVLTSLLSPFAGEAVAQLAPIGLSEVGAQWFDNENLLVYVPEASDRFSFALAAGDFNGDGAEDLATGIPYDNGLAGSGCDDCGAVVVRYAVPGQGLATGVADTYLYQGLPGNPEPGGGAHPLDQFGYALAAGDFNGDGFEDLAVGIPGNFHNDDWGNAGAVQVYFGAATGLQTSGAQFFDEQTEGVPWFISAGDRFGAALAAGDFDGDGFADLAVGAPLTLVDPLPYRRAGAVTVGHGSASGLLPFVGYWISQSSPDIPDDPEVDDLFGAALATGDFNGDGFSDLAIGVPQEDDTGAVHVIFGSSFGLILANNEFFGQGDLGGLPEAGDRFGQALAVGDFDGDGHDDLAIGDPLEDLGPANAAVDAGSITVVYGSSFRFDYSRTGNWWQGNVYDNGAYDQTSDQFGWALSAGDFDGDGRDDLAVGHPGENVLGENDGAVTVLMGAPGFGLVGRFRFLSSGFLGIPGNALQHHQDFGRALAVGDFDGRGFADLAIGVPYHDAPSIPDVGGELVLYGALFADGFELESPFRWSSVGQ